MEYLTFALAKGRLATKTLSILETIGITCEEMKDKDSRKLIFVNEELKLKFFLAKATDVPTYVEYGAADIGVVGRDTILEEDKKIYEVLDLDIGKCRMCVAGPESAREMLESGQVIRVATKYPKIAKDYFFNKKHQTVEIIKLNGSIELAPIVGLSEVIVDLHLQDALGRPHCRGLCCHALRQAYPSPTSHQNHSMQTHLPPRCDFPSFGRWNLGYKNITVPYGGARTHPVHL